MPVSSLLTFGHIQVTSLSSDDLYAPLILQSMERVLFVALPIIAGFFLPSDMRCRSWLLVLFLAINVVLILLEICIAKISTKGTPFNEKPREALGMRAFFRAGIVFFFFEICVLAYISFILVFDKISGAVSTNQMCNRDDDQNHVLAFLIFTGVCFRWLSLFRQFVCLRYCLSSIRDRANKEAPEGWTQRRYRDFWRFICCAPQVSSATSNAQDKIYEQLGTMCEKFFVDAHLALVPSDILAGLALVNEQQEALKIRRRQQTCDREQKTPMTKEDADRDVASKTSNQDDVSSAAKRKTPMSVRETLRAADEILPFAVAIYGWLVHTYVTGGCRSCCGEDDERTETAAHPSNFAGIVEHDKHDRNRRAIVSTLATSRPDAQLVYATFENVPAKRVPYCLFVDWDTRRVILSLRGTLSLGDVITDLVAVEISKRDEEFHRKMSTLSIPRRSNDSNTGSDSIMTEEVTLSNEDEETKQCASVANSTEALRASTSSSSGHSLSKFRRESPGHRVSTSMYSYDNLTRLRGGSFRLRDNTDVVEALGKRFSFPGKGQCAHDGFTDVARNTIDHLDSHGLLDFLLDSSAASDNNNNGDDDDDAVDLVAAEEKKQSKRNDDGRSEARAYRDRVRNAALRALVRGSQCRGGTEDGATILSTIRSWPLVVTGHSLGAGSASLVALFLRNSRPYGARTTCFAFSNPASVMSKELASYCDDFVTSVILGSDIVCRLSLWTMQQLRNRLLLSLLSTKRSKQSILRKAIFGKSNEASLANAEDPAKSFALECDSDDATSAIASREDIPREVRYVDFYLGVRIAQTFIRAFYSDGLVSRRYLRLGACALP